VPARVARLRDEVRAEILFGGEGVVGAAAEGEIVQAMLATSCEGYQVMELEPCRFSAALTRVAPVRAAPLVALEDGATERGGHLSAALASLARVLGSALEL
jgi:hypothetical protein